VDIQIINPITYPGWDHVILSHPDYSFFHSSAWAKVLNKSYGYTPLFFTIFKDGDLSAVVPVMEVNSLLTGKRGVSLPFTDYCNPIIRDGVSFPNLFEFILGYGRDRGWKTLELRGGENLLPHSSTSSTFLGHALELSRDETHIFSNFRDTSSKSLKRFRIC
jgi:hypothetical protein